MVKFKRRSMACALGLATGLCACIGFAAPAGIKTASADYSAPQETTVESAETVAQQPETASPDAIGGIMPLSETKSGSRMLTDNQGRATGYILYAEAYAEDHSIASDVGYMRLHVAYDLTKRDPACEHRSTDCVTVYASIQYFWDYIVSYNKFYNDVYFNSMEVYDEAAGARKTHYKTNGKDYYEIFHMANHFDGSYIFEAKADAKDYTASEYPDSEQKKNKCSYIRLEANAFIVQANGREDFAGSIILDARFN